MKNILVILLCFTTQLIYAQKSVITGIITDKANGDFLPGASITIEKHNLGTSSQTNGEFTLLSVPSGEVDIKVSFIGYRTQTIHLRLQPNETKHIKIVLEEVVYQGKEITVTAQARGQSAAINSQLNATGIINVISSEKLNELPDVNVADAIGRLPGLMIQREGGEGQKIIIRGLEPKYNTVSINGMNAPSTDMDNRSTDLNMISPEIVGGVEVMKANTADKDADGLGGTVNLVLKDAPSSMRLNINGQTGYHSQINDIGHYKGNILFSNRFLKEKLGIIFTASAEQTDRSNDRFLAAYKVQGNPDYDAGETYVQPWITSTRLQSNLEKRNRYNANLNLDFTFGASKLKLLNLVSSMDRDRYIREKRYDLEGTILRTNQTDTRVTETIFSNILQGEHRFWNTFLEWGAGRSQSKRNNPYEHVLGFRMKTPFNVPASELDLLPPDQVSAPGNVNESDLAKYYLYEGTKNTYRADEAELSTWLDWKVPFNFNQAFKGYLKFGGKYRQKGRSKVTARNYVRFDLNKGFNGVIANMPDITRSSQNNLIGIADFLDLNFKSKRFLNGDYENLFFNFALDRKYMATFYNINADLYRPILTTTIQNDYTGYEELSAAYVMAEVNLTDYFTLIPGIRYDHTFMCYNAYGGSDVPDDETVEHTFSFEETSEKGAFSYWLPQIHLQIKPTKWFNIRLAYTNTLSRPDFNLLAPRMILKPTSLNVTYSRTNLRPALSKNFDAIMTFYKPDVGLLTIGGFYKEIENFIYTRSALVLSGTATDPSVFALDEAISGWTITYPLNSPNKAMVKGAEIDLQTQLRSLPGLLKGIVLSANLSFMNSKMGYNETLIKRIVNPNYGIDGDRRRFIHINADTTYFDRLLRQPSILANFSLGYDYQGFSGRLSYNYQDNILIKEQHRTDGADKESTLAFSRWDMQLRQRINKKLDVYLSMSNILNTPDRNKRDITGYPSSIEYYGYAVYIGVKYNVFR